MTIQNQTVLKAYIIKNPKTKQSNKQTSKKQTRPKTLNETSVLT